MDITFLIGISLAILGGAFAATTRFAIKQMPTVQRFTLIGYGYLCALPYYVAWCAFAGLPAVTAKFWAYILIHVTLMLVALWLMIEAHRLKALTFLAPFLALTPVFHLGTGPLMGVPTPTTIWAYAGVVVTVIGLYIINVRSGKMGLFDPFKLIWTERGARYMFLVALIFSVTANLDLLAMREASPSFYLLVDHGAIACSALTISFALVAFKERLVGERLSWKSIGRLGLSNDFKVIPLNWSAFRLFGLATAFEVIPHMIALGFVPTVSYIISAKRLGTIGFSFAYGLYLGYGKKHRDNPDHAGERQNLTMRAVGMAVAAIGMIVVIFNSH